MLEYRKLNPYIVELIEQIKEQYQPDPVCLERRKKEDKERDESNNFSGLILFPNLSEYTYTFDTIKQVIQDADLGFIPRLIQIESINNDAPIRTNVVNDSNISIERTKKKTDKEKRIEALERAWVKIKYEASLKGIQLSKDKIPGLKKPFCKLLKALEPDLQYINNDTLDSQYFAKRYQFTRTKENPWDLIFPEIMGKPSA